MRYLGGNLDFDPVCFFFNQSKCAKTIGAQRPECWVQLPRRLDKNFTLKLKVHFRPQGYRQVKSCLQFNHQIRVRRVKVLFLGARVRFRVVRARVRIRIKLRVSGLAPPPLSLCMFGEA